MNNLHDEYITITDGEISKDLLLLDTFGIEEKDYAALFDEEEDVMYIFEFEIDGEEAVFSPIEDEEELEAILAIYAELLDDEDEEDEDYN